MDGGWTTIAANPRTAFMYIDTQERCGQAVAAAYRQQTHTTSKGRASVTRARLKGRCEAKKSRRRSLFLMMRYVDEARQLAAARLGVLPRTKILG